MSAADPGAAKGRWIPFDFSQGIHSDRFAGTGFTTLKNGAATVTNTEGCYFDPIIGALVPLPKRTGGTAQTQMPYDKSAHTPGTNYMPSTMPNSYLLDGQVMSPFGPDDDPSVLTNPDAVVATFGFFYNSAGTGTPYNIYVLTRLWKLGTSGTLDIGFNKSTTTIANAEFPVYLPGGTIVKTRSTVTSATPPYNAFSFFPILALNYFNDQIAWTVNGTGIAVNDRALTTHDSDMFPANTYIGLTAGAYTQMYPDPDTSTSQTGQTVEYGTGGGYQYMILGHQDRVVGFGFQRNNFGDTSASVVNDFICYSAAGNFARTSSPGAPSSLRIVSENPTAVGAAASMTATDLLIVKHMGGAVLIRGDLDNPEVHRLPMVESTYGVVSHSVVTPVGVVYGSRNGVFIWAGGDTSQKISEQIDGFFWRHELDTTNENYLGPRGRFGYWHPFILTPNNYMFDTRTNAWWRLETPSTSLIPYNAYDVSAGTGKLYAFHYRIDDTWNAAWSTYDWSSIRSSWSWQSQPIIETTDQRIRFEDLELVCMKPSGTSGAVTITVTLTGYEEDGTALTSRAVVFTLTNNTADVPLTIRQRIRDVSNGTFESRYVKVRIQASSATGPAPKVFGLRAWVRDGTRTVTASA